MGRSGENRKTCLNESEFFAQNIGFQTSIDRKTIKFKCPIFFVRFSKQRIQKISDFERFEEKTHEFKKEEMGNKKENSKQNSKEN